MPEAVTTILFGSPLPVALVIAGAICIAIAIVGTIPPVRLTTRRSWGLGVFGGLLLVVAVSYSYSVAPNRTSSVENATGTEASVTPAVEAAVPTQIQLNIVPGTPSTNDAPYPGATDTSVSLPSDLPTAAEEIDITCDNSAQAATIDGVVVPTTDWLADCAYKNVLRGERIVLSTWGILLEKSGTTIVSCRILTPNTEYSVPGAAVLFGGYRSELGAFQAYLQGNPGAPTPLP